MKKTGSYLSYKKSTSMIEAIGSDELVHDTLVSLSHANDGEFTGDGKYKINHLDNESSLSSLKMIPVHTYFVDSGRWFFEDKDYNDWLHMPGIYVPIEVLERGSDENSFLYIKRGVAKHKDTPEYILSKLSKDEEIGVRIAVARNGNCSKDIIEELSRDKSINVRCSLVFNPNCPTDILEKLSIDECYCVRHAVAENTSTPIEIVQKLLSDDNSYVREVASHELTRRMNISTVE